MILAAVLGGFLGLLEPVRRDQPAWVASYQVQPAPRRDAGVLQEEGGRVQRHRAASRAAQQAGDGKLRGHVCEVSNTAASVPMSRNIS